MTTTPKSKPKMYVTRNISFEETFFDKIWRFVQQEYHGSRRAFSAGVNRLIKKGLEVEGFETDGKHSKNLHS